MREEVAILNLSIPQAERQEPAIVSEPFFVPVIDDAPPLPPHLPESTVSEIASWLVGHTIKTVERELILHTLAHCAGNRAWAASILGISVPALEAKLASYAGPRIVPPQRGDNENESVDPEDSLGALPESCGDEQTVPAEIEPAEIETETLPAKPRHARVRRNATGGVALYWLIGSALMVIAIIAIAFRFFGDNAAVAALIRAQPPRIELSLLERTPPVPQPAALPLPAAPPVAAASAVDPEQDTRMDSAPAVLALDPMPTSAPRETLAEAAAAGFEEKVVAVTAFEGQLPKLEEPDFEIAAAVVAAATQVMPEPAPAPVARPTQIAQPKSEARAERAAPRPAPATAQAKAKTEPNQFPIFFPFSAFLSGANGKAAGTNTAAQPRCCNNY